MSQRMSVPNLMLLHLKWSFWYICAGLPLNVRGEEKESKPTLMVCFQVHDASKFFRCWILFCSTLAALGADIILCITTCLYTILALSQQL